MNIPKFSEGSH